LLLATGFSACHDRNSREESASQVQGQERGTSQAAHIVLTGSYKVDAEASGNCAVFPNKSLQVGFVVLDRPWIVLQVENFHGAGDYDAEGRVRANYSGETIRQSRGPVKAKIEVAAPVGGERRNEISGSFTGTYQGDAGGGTISGTFKNCLYELHPAKG